MKGAQIRPKQRQKGFRARTAFCLVRLARWVYPDSDEVMAFYAQMIHDQMIYGKAITRVDPEKMHHEP